VPMTDSISTFHPTTPAGAVLGRIVARLDAWMFQRRERAELVRTLRMMGDRDLRDLGISRADFPAIVEGVYRR
jgi:uncharacterized protein YjiS (DUF1127 family)